MPVGSLSRTLTRLTLRLVPLTPVHIGDGTEMRLDEYFLENDSLCRFDPSKAMRAMNAQQREKFGKSDDLRVLAQMLRAAGKGCVEERIAITQTSRRELGQAIDDPNNRTGAVRPFVRGSGRPYIPGSSVKGAFRTALASAALPRDCRDQESWDHDSAMQAALGADPRDTTKDPLRFLHISDVLLPEGCTVIDRAEIFHPKKPNARNMQMHYERTRSLAEDSAAITFEATVMIDSRAMEIAPLQARFSARGLIDTVRAFHARLFNREVAAFFEDPNLTMQRKLTAHKAPDGRPPIIEQKFQSDFLLLRLGRFGHFESKSLDGVRRGHFPQLKKFGKEIGSPDQGGHTRTVVRIGDKVIPFGWVIGWVVKEETL